eukprot:Opistho-2@65776
MSTRNQDKPLSEVLKDAGKRALGGGLPGAAAMGIQVFSLMWLRTTMNYQYRHGTTTAVALKTLYSQGGILRFYKGVGPALIQGPLSRFGDTASNAGILSLLNNYDQTKNLPVGVKTAAASVTAGLFRIILTPVDTVKTIMQVEGSNGIPALAAKIKANGVRVMFHGAVATAAATMVGHFPWFFTFNLLDERIPRQTVLYKKLMRNAVIGFVSSVVSDTCSNSIRVIKTTKQTSVTAISYPQAVKLVVDSEGVMGLFGRGLKTRILTNGLQGLLFTVLWKMLEEQYAKRVN